VLRPVCEDQLEIFWSVHRRQKRRGHPASHGCVRLHPDNAAVFFSMAQTKGLRNTKIVISQ